MATYETYTHKGKEYKFRVGRDEPKLEKFQLRSSDYYKEKQKSLRWSTYVNFYPVLVAIIAGIYAAFGGQDIYAVIGFLMIPYIFLVFEADGKAGQAGEVLADLKEKAENEEYMEAYRAWTNQ